MVQPQKIEIVEGVTDRLSRSSAVVVVGYQGMTVEAMSNLRAKLRETESELHVIKNNLSRRALEQSGCESLDDLLIGPVALAFGFGDPTSLAKTCVDYSKANEKFVLKGGLLDRKRIESVKLQALAKLPSRQQLLAQMAGTIMAPARQLVTAMNQAMAKVVYAMKARSDQMQA